jgi:hypothetical protein
MPPVPAPSDTSSRDREERTSPVAAGIAAPVAAPVAVPVAAPVAVPVAVPVALALGERHVGSVRRWLEGTLGWQAVEDDLDGPVPPAVRIVDLDGAARLLEPGPGPGPASGTGWSPDPGGADRLPTVLLVEDDEHPGLAADLARRLVPSGVCRWPGGRDALPTLVARAIGGPRRAERTGRTLRVGGVAGGVGTTTVALALAGLAAWSGQRALAVVHGHAGVRSATPVPADALVAPDLWARAAPLPGLVSARVVHTGRSVPHRPPEDRRIGLSVLDVGTTAEVDVVVCRPDGAAAQQLPTTMAGAVVVVGQGLLSAARVRELAGGRTVVHVPTSVRVARTVLRGQAPAGLPGRWLAQLGPILADG